MSIFDEMRVQHRIIYPERIFNRAIYMHRGRDPVYCYARLVDIMARILEPRNPERQYIVAIYNLWQIFNIDGSLHETKNQPIIKMKPQQ